MSFKYTTQAAKRFASSMDIFGRTATSFVHCLLICSFTSHCTIEASHYYCVNHNTVTLTLDPDPEQSEAIIPTADAPSESIRQLSCTWQVSAPTANATVVARGFKVTQSRRWKRAATSHRENRTKAEIEQPPRIRYRLTGPAVSSECSSHAISSDHILESTDSFRVLPLPMGSSLTVTYNQVSSQNGNLPPGLMLQLVHPGFCTRDLVNFDRRCHGKSEAKRSLMDELAFINGDSKTVQLAGFSSISQIRQFLAVSQLTFVGSGEEMLSKQPLDLKQPVRIGLFYDKLAGSISYLSSGNGTCEMKEIQDRDAFPFTDLSTNSTHACGSLRVAELSGTEVIEFWNCDRPLPALLSFAETPMQQCSNCSETVVSWVPAVTADPSDRSVKKWWIVVSISLPAILIAIVITVIIVRKRLNAFSRLCRKRTQQAEEEMRRTPSDAEAGISAADPLNAVC